MAEEPELPFDENGRLDVRELCYQELVMEVPTVLLCSDDCAGLCPICGRRKLVLAHRKPTAMLWMKGLHY